MSSIRVSNIEAKADASSPTVDEKLKVTNSQGRVLMHVDGKTSGITTIGINTTGNTFTVNANNGVTFAGVVTSTGGFSGNVTGTVNSSGIATFSNGIVVSAGSASAPSISPSGDSNTGIFFPAADTVAIGEGGAEVLRVTSSGTVGVNTTAVDAQLEVHSAASKINTVTIKTSAGASGYAGLAFMAGQTTAGREKAAIYFQETNGGAHYTGDIVFALNNTSGSAVQVSTSDERLRITSTGNLGIGTASPSEKTHISGTGDIKLRVGTTSSGVNANAALSLTSASEGSWVVQTGNAVSSGLRFYDTTAGAERFRIASNGAWGLSGANYGSSGEVLTSNGSGSAPTWQGLSILGSTSQTWTNVLSSRSNGTTYTNSTGRPIMVILSGNDNPNQALNYTFQVQGSNIGVALPNVAPGYSMIVGVHIVPNNQTYRAAWNASANLSQWWELR